MSQTMASARMHLIWESAGYTFCDYNFSELNRAFTWALWQLLAAINSSFSDRDLLFQTACHYVAS